jgi:hypothetical protein
MHSGVSKLACNVAGIYVRKLNRINPVRCYGNPWAGSR